MVNISSHTLFSNKYGQFNFFVLTLYSYVFTILDVNNNVFKTVGFRRSGTCSNLFDEPSLPWTVM